MKCTFFRNCLWKVFVCQMKHQSRVEPIICYAQVIHCPNSLNAFIHLPSPFLFIQISVSIGIEHSKCLACLIHSIGKLWRITWTHRISYLRVCWSIRWRAWVISYLLLWKTTHYQLVGIENMEACHNWLEDRGSCRDSWRCCFTKMNNICSSFLEMKFLAKRQISFAIFWKFS